MKVTDCELAPSISAVAPSVIVTAGPLATGVRAGVSGTLTKAFDARPTLSSASVAVVVNLRATFSNALTFPGPLPFPVEPLNDTSPLTISLASVISAALLCCRCRLCRPSSHFQSTVKQQSPSYHPRSANPLRAHWNYRPHRPQRRHEALLINHWG